MSVLASGVMCASVACAALCCGASDFFSRAVPVWPAGRAEAMNDNVRFKGVFAAPKSGRCVLSIAGSTCYRVRLNGEFLAFGPARGPKGMFRVDRLDLAGRLKDGENVVEVDVQGANVNSFEFLDQPSFLQAEVSSGGDTLLATSADGAGFSASDATGRVRRVPRFDYQRLFAEAYRVGGGSGEILDLEERPRVRLLPRVVPQPEYALDGSFRKAKSVRRRYDREAKVHVGREIDLVGKNGYKGYRPSEFEVDVNGEIQRYVPDPGGTIQSTLWRGEKVSAGFVGLEVRVSKPGRLVAFASETEHLSFADPDCGYAVFWDISEPGEYVLEAFDPRSAMFVETFIDGGEADVTRVWMREFKSPLPFSRRYSGTDPELRAIYDAAAETLAQNSVDIFTDCPSRERAGWIGDTFFTARASKFLSGTTLVEDAFLGNFALAERFDNVPEGAIPMVYPGDHPNGEFIPNFCMWLAMQTAEYAKRGGRPDVVAALKTKLIGLARYLEGFLNADGLLENLPGWVFLEWSAMRDHVKGVNYPSNMQYAGMLDALAELCGDKSFAERAAKVRALVRERSWNGTWFRDCDRDDGCTEGCQYYAFFFGVADFERDRELWNRLVTHCGPLRDPRNVYPELPRANSIFGFYMRFDMLLKTGRRDVLEREAKAYFLPMAKATGTIWEGESSNGSASHGLSSIAAYFVDPPSVPTACVSFDAPGHVYVEGAAPLARGGEPGAAYAVVDWRGRPIVDSGTWREDGTAALPRLPTGYYRIKGGAADATFAVVPAPEGRSLDHGSFYGVDSAQSWVSRPGSFKCPWNGGDTYRTVSDLIRLAGVSHVRERLSSAEVCPSPGKFEGRHYMYNADLLRERGILVAGMFHDTPKWCGKMASLPSDLAAVHALCSKIASAFGDRMGDWEFWNEEDIGFSSEPVWDYAAALKAAYLGFKAARPEMPALPGALCQKPDSPYARALFENDAAKFGDVFNYHTYLPLSQYPATFASLRAFLGRYGIGGRAVWLTESGTHLEGPSKDEGAMKGFKAHSPEQELLLAEFYPKSQIALQMEGVARNYFFVFGAFNEQGGTKDWGVMRRDGTVKPVYAAISAMVGELASARLAGEVKVGDGLRAYLFDQPDGSQTVAYWSVSPLDTATGGKVESTPDCERTMRLAAPDGEYRLVDTCGMRSVAAAKGGALALASTRYPSYVSGLRGLKADVAPKPCGKVLPYAAADDEDLSVVIRAEFDGGDFEVTNQKTLAVLKGNRGKVRVVVWNLGDTAKTGTVEVAGARLVGLPDRPFALGPRGTAPAVFDCTLEPADDDPADTALVLTGRFNGRRSSRLYASLLLESRFLAKLVRVPVAWRDPAKDWKRNTSANDCKVSWDEKEQAVRFDMDWADPNADKWFYPVHELDLPQESLKDACMLEFEVKSGQNKVENDFVCANLMLVYGDGSRPDFYLSYPSPIGRWERRLVKVDEVEAIKDVASLRVGANPKGSKCTFWIRNLAILKKSIREKERR